MWEVKDKSARLPKQRRGRTAASRFSIAGMAMVLFLYGGVPLVSQEMQDNEDFLVGVLLKNLALKERIASDIPVSDRELQRSERIFLEAENRMTIATETHNNQAAWEARGPLDTARADLKKLRQARARLDQAMARADVASAAARNLLLSGQGSSLPIGGLASLHSGKAKILKKNGNEVNLEDGRPRFLEPGDEIVTMGSSLADVQVLNGRATVLLGERSRLKLEEGGSQGKKLRLVQGRIYSTIDKRDDFAGLLQSGAAGPETDPKLGEAIVRARERIQELTDKSFAVLTPSACLVVASTRFTIGLLKSGAVEISVLEGTVEAGDAECSHTAPVEEGFTAVASKEGISEPKKTADADRWWEK